MAAARERLTDSVMADDAAAYEAAAAEVRALLAEYRAGSAQVDS